MPIAFSLLVALIAVTPILVFASGIAETSVATLVAALTLLVGAWLVPADELARAARAKARVWLLLIAPAVWMLIQLAPLPLGPLTHPIWISAAAALGELRFGHITMSPTDTIRALATYLGIAVLVPASMLVLVNRRRAELCLAALIVATSAVAGFGLFQAYTGAAARDAVAAAGGMLGCILCCASARDFVERRQRHRSPEEQAAHADGWLLVIAILGLPVCLGAVVVLSASVWIATLLGVLTFTAVVLANVAAGLRGAHHAILPLIVLAAAIAVAATYTSVPAGGSLLVALAADDATTAARLAADTGWLGAGAGTYASLARTYQELAQPVQATPPSTMVRLAVELGAAAPYVAALAALWVAQLLIGWAMQRGRDAFYSAAAAGCIVALTLQAFRDASLLNPAIGLLAALVLGLGLAQAHGRSGQR